jgi:hypothetical protein
MGKRNLKKKDARKNEGIESHEIFEAERGKANAVPAKKRMPAASRKIMRDCPQRKRHF